MMLLLFFYPLLFCSSEDILCSIFVADSLLLISLSLLRKENTFNYLFLKNKNNGNKNKIIGALVYSFELTSSLFSFEELTYLKILIYW